MEMGRAQPPLWVYILSPSPSPHLLGVLLLEVLFLFHSVYGLMKYKAELWISQITFKLPETR